MADTLTDEQLRYISIREHIEKRIRGLGLDYHMGIQRGIWEIIDDELTALRAEREKIEAVVEPIVAIANFYDASPEYTRVDSQDVVVMVRPNGEAFHLTYYHCAAVRDAFPRTVEKVVRRIIS